MPVYSYKGRDKDGAMKAGKRMANSPDALSSQLLQENIFPIQITEERPRKGFLDKINRLLQPVPTTEELAIFARQMYTLTKTGVPLASALRNLADNTVNERMAEALYGIVDRLEGGQDLAASMQNYPDVFPSMIVNLVRVGQSSGRLSEGFLYANDYLESEANSRKNLKSALRYPMFVAISLIVAIIVINVFVIPSFANVFQQAHVTLPLPTRIFIAVSNFMLHDWVFILLFLAIVYALLRYYYHTPQGHYRFDKWILYTPFIGKMVRRIIMLRFAEAFAITIQSGVPLIEGVTLVAQSIENRYARAKILLIREAIEHGKTLTQSAAATELFSPLELQMLNVSEETGELSDMLKQIAEFYQREVSYDMKRLNDVIEPIMILLLGGIVLMLALAVYLPVWNIAKAAKLG